MTNDQCEVEVRRGIKLRSDGDLSGAISVYEAVDKAAPDNSMVLHMLAHALWEAERYDEGYEAYKRLVKLSPESESAAIGFFHCAWAMGEYNEAMAEVTRFQERERASDDFEQFLRWLDTWGKMRRNYDFKDMDRFKIAKRHGFSMPDIEPEEDEDEEVGEKS
jgi:tetratricopeptide (TPR) repeat protein